MKVEPSKITIGYNRSGQEFFDWIKDKGVHDIFFGVTHDGYNKKYNEGEFYNEFIKLNTYNLPMNLLLNAYDDDKRWDELISKYNKLCNLSAVTCLKMETAKKIREKYPNLLLHLSTQAAIYYSYKSCKIFDYVNVNGAYNFSKDKIEKYRKYTKVKFIANEGCIVGRTKNFGKLDNFGMFEKKCCNRVCERMQEIYPWLELARINIYKEFLDYVEIDLLKLATRNTPLDKVKALYEYWTTDGPTTVIGNNIAIKNNEAYNKWIQKRLTDCHYDCASCQFCKEIYKEITCN